MQGFAERKKEEKRLLDGEEKKQPMAPRTLSLSEGPMILEGLSDVEKSGRFSFESDVRRRLDSSNGGKKKGKKGKKGKKRQKKIRIR